MNKKHNKYEKFCDELKTKILENASWNVGPEDYHFYPEGFCAKEDSKEQDFVYRTNMKYYGIASEILQGDFIALDLHVDEETVCMCRFALAYLFKEYEEEGWEKIEFILQENITLALSVNIEYIFQHLTDYEFMRKRLMVRCINYYDNMLELEHCVYQMQGDIALVLYATMYNDQRGLGAMKVSQELLRDWGVEQEEVFEEALNNTYTHAQPRLYTNLWDVIHTPSEKGAFMSVLNDVDKLEKTQVPLVTTTKKLNGAIALFFPGVKEKLAELFGGSYYVAFTSLHEARIHHCDSISQELVEASLRDVNEHFEENEVLSRLVHLYDAENKTFHALIS